MCLFIYFQPFLISPALLLLLQFAGAIKLQDFGANVSLAMTSPNRRDSLTPSEIKIIVQGDLVLRKGECQSGGGGGGEGDEWEEEMKGGGRDSSK